MLNLVQLAGFVAVAEELHFGRAAERLRMTQPPLSRQIQLLERELAVSLLDRSSRTVRLTPAGRAFLADARRLLADADRSTAAVRKITAGQSGVLRIGFTAASAYAGLDVVLRAAQRLGRDVAVDLAELVTADQLEALSRGTLDLGLSRPAAGNRDLASRDLVSEPFVVAVPHDHPLARDLGPVALAELDSVDMIMYSPVESRYFHDLLGPAFAAAGVVPHPVQQLSQIHSLLALVDLGWGVAVIPASASRHAYSAITYRPLADQDLRARLVLRWRTHSDDPVLLRLLDTLGHDPDPDPTPAETQTMARIPPSVDTTPPYGG